MKPQPKKQGKQLSAVVKNSWANSQDFGFIWILMSTLPTIFNAKLVATNTLFLKAFMIPGFPSRSYVSKLISEMVLPLFNSAVTNFTCKNNSTLNHFVLLVEHTLITLVYSVLFFRGQFRLIRWNFHKKKTITAALCPMALIPT